MSDLKILIILASIFYIVYTFVKIYTIEDSELVKYRFISELDFEGKKEILIDDAKEEAISELTGVDMEKLTPDEERGKIRDASKRYIKLTVDEEFLEESVEEFDDLVLDLYLYRLLKLSAIEFLAHLYLLLPVLIIVATGSIFMALVTSALVMTFYSLTREEYLREVVDSVYGSDIADDIISSTRVKISTIGRALLNQSYLFIYIYINLRS